MSAADDLIQQTLRDAEAAASRLIETASHEREAARGQLRDVQRELVEALRDQQSIRQRYREACQNDLRSQLQRDVGREFAWRLLQGGESVADVADLLDLPDGLVAQLAERLP